MWDSEHTVLVFIHLNGHCLIHDCMRCGAIRQLVIRHKSQHSKHKLWMLGSLSISITVNFLNARRLPPFEPKIKKSPAEKSSVCFFCLQMWHIARFILMQTLSEQSRLNNPVNIWFWTLRYEKHQLSWWKKQCHNLLTAAVIPLYIIRFLKHCTDDPQMNTCRSFFAGD